MGAMDILSSRVLLRPADLARSLRFYAETLDLPVYREFGSGVHHGVVFFLGGGFLEVSGSAGPQANDKLQLWLQVRDVDEVHHELRAAGVEIVEPPIDKPWGLREMRAADPDGVRLVFVEVPEDHPLRRDPR